MNTLFAYGGSRKSALTPRTVLFGAYSATDVYSSDAVVGKFPYTVEYVSMLCDVTPLKTAAALNDRIAAMDVAMAVLAKYEVDMNAYYTPRMRDTSGGKHDRLSAERGVLGIQARDERLRLVSARATASRLLSSVVVVTQDDFNPKTGVVLTPVEKEIVVQQAAAKAASASSGMSGLIIPIGAALAALFFLKGH